MTDSLVALILNCKTSKYIWIALHERYEGDKKKMIIEARNDVSRLTMRKEENWEEYLYRAEKLLEQARNLGADIQDQEFITSVIRGLPQKYNLVALQLNCQMKYFDRRIRPGSTEGIVVACAPSAAPEARALPVYHGYARGSVEVLEDGSHPRELLVAMY
ncbi:hypothetical protein LAZ67_19001891 [Cordylochernes scorpioides]|uniref:Uncharacterized protein n=1 Tax=Cordylochernes scorpioides TaxID=51811 RepID=A0ABY6LKA2_9ARAC|nr:hypothetical protein LAZ67_19001891 [Cordylochernes scorpioides]